MTYLELVLLAVGLCFDTFAVSIGGGIQTPQMTSLQRVKAISVFGILQAMFLFAGWVAGTFFASFINEWDHWIAFVILLYLGGKMVYEGAVFDSEVFDSKRVTIPAYKFSAQKARILLMLALSCTKNHETIKSFFQEY